MTLARLLLFELDHHNLLLIDIVLFSSSMVISIRLHCLGTLSNGRTSSLHHQLARVVSIEQVLRHVLVSLLVL